MSFLHKCFLIFGTSVLLLSACKQKSSSPTVDTSDSVAESKPDSIKTIHPEVAEENNIYADVDISPMDMSYFPSRYPQQKMANPNVPPPVMRVIYSRPHLQGRKLFEEILKYGEVWRLGANEATELDIFQPVTIGDKKLAPGRYTLYAIPQAGYWTIVVNNDLDLWGLKQDMAQDLVKVKVPVTYYNQPMEYFTMAFERADEGANLIIAWDDALVKVPIKI